MTGYQRAAGHPGPFRTADLLLRRQITPWYPVEFSSALLGTTHLTAAHLALIVGVFVGEHRRGQMLAIWWGLCGLLFHDLRRSAIRNTERAGISREVGKNVSGHKTDSAYKRYNIVDNWDIENTGKKLAEFLKRQT